MIQNAYSAAREAILAADTDEVTRCTAIALMAGYTARWNDHDWQTVAVEEEFHLPLLNPKNWHRDPKRTWAGKRDARALNRSGKLWIWEHKTTSEDIQDPNCTYRRRLAVDGQASAYSLASLQEGEPVEGVMYDVIRKPTIKPKAIAQKQRAEIASLYTYAGQKVSQETRGLVVSGLEKENGELYGLRLQADIAEDPARYFQRWAIIRLDQNLEEFAHDLWAIAGEIRDAQAKGTHYKNPGACMQWGRPCEFLGLCSNLDTVDSDRWVREDNPHRELSEATPEALTNSRIRCFQTCRRKHHYRYNLGLTRPQDEDAEALQFGTLLHRSLEAWFSAFIPENENGDSRSEGTNSATEPEWQATTHAGEHS